MAAGDVLAVAGAAKASGESQPHPGVRLAVAVLLLWLAGLMFFIAFGEGINSISWPSGGPGKGLAAFRKGLATMLGKGSSDLASVEAQQQSSADLGTALGELGSAASHNLET